VTNKVKVLALFGKSGAGKDTIQDLIVGSSEGNLFPYHRIISCTTRPRRSCEIDGIDYQFLSDDEFASLIYEDKMLEALEFNGWFYGAPIDSLDPHEINVGIFTPEGIEALQEGAEGHNLMVLPVFIACVDPMRITRSLWRELNPDIYEIFRRYKTDEEDFDNIRFNYLTIYNNEEPMDELDIVETINNYCLDFFD